MARQIVVLALLSIALAGFVSAAPAAPPSKAKDGTAHSASHKGVRKAGPAGAPKAATKGGKATAAGAPKAAGAGGKDAAHKAAGAGGKAAAGGVAAAGAVAAGGAAIAKDGAKADSPAPAPAHAAGGAAMSKGGAKADSPAPAVGGHAMPHSSAPAPVPKSNAPTLEVSIIAGVGAAAVAGYFIF